MSDFNLTYRQIGDLGNKIGGNTGAKGILSGDFVVVSRNEAIRRGVVLAFDRKVSVVRQRLIVSESFTGSNHNVYFRRIDEKLTKLFRRREDVLAGELAIHTLITENAHDPDIMAAIEPHSKRFIKLGHFYQLIEAQGCGQEGPLLVNGRSNIAYVLDKNGAPWPVNVFWSLGAGGWILCIPSVANPDGWFAGDRFISLVA